MPPKSKGPKHGGQGGVNGGQILRFLRDNSAGMREVQQEPARGPVGRVHGAQETPRLRQQLPHSGGLHRREELASMDRAEMRHVPERVQLRGPGTDSQIGNFLIRIPPYLPRSIYDESVQIRKVRCIHATFIEPS